MPIDEAFYKQSNEIDEALDRIEWELYSKIEHRKIELQNKKAAASVLNFSAVDLIAFDKAGKNLKEIGL